MQIVIALFALPVLTGCEHSPAQPHPPDQWLPLTPATGDDCRIPAGLFANQGVSSDPGSTAPSLATLLFDDHLAGFPVQGIRIDFDAGQQSLLLRGVLAGVDLQQTRVITMGEGDCASRWQLETDSPMVDASLRTQSFMYTGGLFVPLTEDYVVSLQLAGDGALLVHLRIDTLILGALMIPFKVSDECWLRYERYLPALLPAAP